MSATTRASGTARPSLGILQCGRAPAELLGRHPDYPDLFVELLGRDAFDYRRWAVLDGELPAGANAADAWLITGSRHGAYEEHAWIPPLEALVREIRDRGQPLVGICFGHQIIAQALGGRVEKFAGGWSVGRVDYRLADDAFAAGTPSARADTGADTRDGMRRVPLMAYHQDQVTEPPPGAVTLGESDVCRHAALAIGDTIRTLQPHPEFDAAFVAGLFETRGAALPPERLARGRASLASADEVVGPARAGIGRELRDFLLDGVRGRAAAMLAVRERA